MYCTLGVHHRAEVRKIEEEHARKGIKELPWTKFGVWPDSNLFSGSK